MYVYLQAALLLILLAISAFFAACEVAFLSISAVRMHSLLEKGVMGAESLARLRHNRRRVVISLLIGNNIANVGASAFATSIMIALFGEAGLGYAVGVMSFLLLTIGDIAPKSTATTYGEKIALAFAPIIEGFYWISYPLVLVFEGINRLIPGVYSRATGIERFTEEEVRSAIKLGAAHKGITEEEKKLIENVLSFKDKTVGDAMTPKASVITLHAEMSVYNAHKTAVKSQYSRFPVIDRNGKVHGTIGIRILGKELYEHPEWPIMKVVWPHVIANVNEKVEGAFARLQRMGRNIAIVMDDDDEFVGLVTLEDLLEEIVGELK